MRGGWERGVGWLRFEKHKACNPQSCEPSRTRCGPPQRQSGGLWGKLVARIRYLFSHRAFSFIIHSPYFEWHSSVANIYYLLSPFLPTRQVRSLGTLWVSVALGRVGRKGARREGGAEGGGRAPLEKNAKGKRRTNSQIQKLASILSFKLVITAGGQCLPLAPAALFRRSRVRGKDTIPVVVFVAKHTILSTIRPLREPFLYCKLLSGGPAFCA